MSPWCTIWPTVWRRFPSSTPWQATQVSVQVISSTIGTMVEMLILPCFKNAWDRIQNHQSKYYVLRKTSDTNEREWGPKMEFTSALWPTCLGSKRKRPGLTIRIMNYNNNDKINCSIWSAHAFPVYHFWKFGGEGGRLCPMQRLVKMKNVSWKLWIKRYTYF